TNHMIISGAIALGTALGVSGTIGAAGLAVGAGGLYTNIKGQQQQAKAQKQAEKLRERQMKIEADRARREAARNMMRERAAGLTAGVAQGAFFGSGLAGGLGQIASTGGQRTGDINMNQTIGQGLFAANAKFSEGSTQASIGTGMMKLGGAIFGSKDALGNMLTPGSQEIGPWQTSWVKNHWGPGADNPKNLWS